MGSHGETGRRAGLIIPWRHRVPGAAVKVRILLSALLLLFSVRLENFFAMSSRSTSLLCPHQYVYLLSSVQSRKLQPVRRSLGRPAAPTPDPGTPSCKTSCIDSKKQQITPDPLEEVRALETSKNRVNTGLSNAPMLPRNHKKSGDDGIRPRALSVAHAALSQLRYVPIVSPDR